MAITEKSIKLLWSNAAGRCSFPGCDMRLTVEQAAGSAPYTLGEMAHIKGRNPGSNRYDASQSMEERDRYENLILLCPNHHTEIDKPENETRYSSAWLVDAKLNHEHYVLSTLTRDEVSTIDDLKDRIAILLDDNHQAWSQYGPNSHFALTNPHNQEAYEVWVSERLSTIVPNNRAIAQLIAKHRAMFSRDKQSIISRFLSHVRSYERWVNDEIIYQAVERFPTDFEKIIKE